MDHGGAYDVFGDDFFRVWGSERANPIVATPTGLPTWDNACGHAGNREGLAAGWFVTIGGNPGYGKTLLSLNVTASGLAVGHDVGYASLEMPPEALAERVYSIGAGVDPARVGRGKHFNVDEFKRQRSTVAAWAKDKGRLFTNREPIYTVEQVLAFLTWLYEEKGVRVFVVDYVQLVGTGDDDDITRQTIRVVTALRAFAYGNRCLVVALSQYNRSTSSNYYDTPRCQGLYGGMAIEANSDQVILLDHSRYEKDPMRKAVARSWLFLDKNRWGQKHLDIPIEWDFERGRVREGLPDEADSMWPRHDKKSGNARR